MNEKKQLIVIGGPTASGKTEVAIQLARAFSTSILSADSRQFYREMSIGTAKPSPEELLLAPHYFINSLSIHDTYSAGDYERDALLLLEELFEKNDQVLLTGGSGLFIRAVCEGLDEFPDVPKETLQAITQLYEKEGLSALQQQLKKLDPHYYQEVDLQNPHRLIRALSVCEASGRPFSGFRQGIKKTRPFQAVYFCLEWERAQLYERINRRVDQMMTAGLLEEAQQLYPHRHLKPLQTVGYQELFDYFDGLHSLERALELIKQNSRRYAKRQLTWFRKRKHWQWFRTDQVEEMVREVGRQVGR
jgi:tRNA dimethylallyltransferase